MALRQLVGGGRVLIRDGELGQCRVGLDQDQVTEDLVGDQIGCDREEFAADRGAFRSQAGAMEGVHEAGVQRERDERRITEVAGDSLGLHGLGQARAGTAFLHRDRREQAGTGRGGAGKLVKVRSAAATSSAECAGSSFVVQMPGTSNDPITSAVVRGSPAMRSATDLCFRASSRSPLTASALTSPVSRSSRAESAASIAARHHRTASRGDLVTSAAPASA